MVSGLLALSGTLVCMLVYGKKRYNYVKPSVNFRLGISALVVFALMTLLISGAMGYWLEFFITLIVSTCVLALWSAYVRKTWDVYGDDYDDEDGLKMTDSGDILKRPDEELVFSTVSELISKENIEDLHYTTLYIDGNLVAEGSRFFIIERTNDKETARIEVVFDGETPTVSAEEKHRYKGTLISENGRTFIQWAKIYK